MFKSGEVFGEIIEYHPNGMVDIDYLGTIVTLPESENELKKSGSDIRLLAPNGQPSNLPPSQYALVRTPAFKAWFGDWEKLARVRAEDSGIDDVTLANLEKNVSKIVDENGEPMVVFHGTNEEFNEFDVSKTGWNTGNYGHHGYGAYFSYDKREAAGYGKTIFECFAKAIKPFTQTEQNFMLLRQNGIDWLPDIENVGIDFESVYTQMLAKDAVAAYLMKCINQAGFEKGWELFFEKYTTSESPLDLNDITDLMEYVNNRNGVPDYIESVIKSLNLDYSKVKFIKGYSNSLSLVYNVTHLGERSKEFTETIKQLGFDAVEAGSELVLFKPTQIKLANGNTTFDASSPDVRLANGGPTRPLAPNGRPSNLTAEQYLLVRTPAFKAWFGDWEHSPATASKVVDGNGEPLVVYHGTLQTFNAFNTYFENGTWHGKGAYFTSSKKDLLANYVTTAQDKTMTCFLSIKNPVIVGKKGESTWFEKYQRDIIRTNLRLFKFPRVNYAYEHCWDSDNLEKVVRNEWGEFNSGKVLGQIYRDLGFDGIVFLAPHKLKGHTAPKGTGHFVAFNAVQIKLANGNTTFDASSPDVRLANGGPTRPLAPNGRPSNLTAEQYLLVRTPAFKAWFGDWEHSPATASKVVDGNGEPLVVYHGTNRQINIFDPTLKGKNFAEVNKGKLGFYFTNEKDYKSSGIFGTNADEYAKNSASGGYGVFINDEKHTILEVFLNIRNPLLVKDSGWGSAVKILDKHESQWINAGDYNNYDGFIAIDTDSELLNGSNEMAIAVNYSSQIKLADGTNTTFDNSPDVRLAKGGSADLGLEYEVFNEKGKLFKLIRDINKSFPLTVDSYHLSENKRIGFASNSDLREKYKPIIDEIRTMVKGETIRLYRSKDVRYADKDVTSWSLKRDIAESFSKGREERIYDPTKSEIVEKDIPVENILAISNTMYEPEFMGKKWDDEPQSQYEFIIENADKIEPASEFAQIIYWHGSDKKIKGEPKVGRSDSVIKTKMGGIPFRDLWNAFYVTDEKGWAEFFSPQTKSVYGVQLKKNAKIIDLSDVAAESTHLKNKAFLGGQNIKSDFPFQKEFDAYAFDWINKAREKNGRPALTKDEFIAKDLQSSFRPTHKNWFLDDLGAEAFADYVKDKGYDAVKFGREIAILNPDIAKFAEPEYQIGGSTDLIHTPAFKAWFGTSKVVDENGEPLLTYRGQHGVSGEIESRLPAISFSSKIVAQAYSQVPNNQNKDSIAIAPKVVAGYLSIQKPVINTPDDPFIDFSVIIGILGIEKAYAIAEFTAPYIYGTDNWNENFESYKTIAQLKKENPNALSNVYVDAYPVFDTPEFVGWFAEKGYDGVIHGGAGVSLQCPEYKVFDKRQIMPVPEQMASGGEVAPDTNVALTTADKKVTANILTGPAETVLSKLVRAGVKFDCVFLDPAYFSRALLGGNRGIKQYGFIYPPEFNEVMNDVKLLMRNKYSHCYLMLAGSQSAQVDMEMYLTGVLEAGFKIVENGSYQKLFSNGKPVTNVRGKVAEPERLLVLSLSGKIKPENIMSEFSFVRPSGYQSEKAPGLLKQIIEQSTTPGQTVLDAFAGSGVAGEQAILAGRNVFLIEKNETVVESLIIPRVTKAIEQYNLEHKPEGQLHLFAKGGKIDNEVYQKWKSLVNMTSAELEKFYNSEEGKAAGLSSAQAKKLGIHYGRESARWIMRMKNTPIEKWTPEMWEWANRQIRFNSRMLGNKGPLYDANGQKTRKHTSLLIWGHNPEKKESGGSAGNYPSKRWLAGQLRNNIRSRVDYPVLDMFIVGSEAKGTAKKDSDIDIAVIISESKRVTSLKRTENYHSKFINEFDKPKWNGRVIDFQFFYPSDVELEKYSKIKLESGGDISGDNKPRRVPMDMNVDLGIHFGQKIKSTGEIIVAHSTSSNLLPQILRDGLIRDKNKTWETSSSNKLFFEIEPSATYYRKNVYAWKAVQQFGGVEVTLYVKVKQSDLRMDTDDNDLGRQYRKNQKQCFCDVPPENILGLEFVMGIQISPKDFLEFYELFHDNDGAQNNGKYEAGGSLEEKRAELKIAFAAYKEFMGNRTTLDNDADK